MKVNFNNLRKQAIHAHDRFVRKLNEAMTTDSGEFAGYVVIHPDDIQQDMDDLRSLIGSIAMCHEEGNADCANVYDELFPEGSKKGMESFNDEE